MIDSDASWKLFDTIKSIASSNGQSTNAMATCVRVLSDGTRMMQLVGSSILTPLNGNMAAEISQGDMAEVRIEDGVMSLTANVSNPSVGQSEVDDAVSDRATVRQLGESNARIEHLEVTALTAESATIANLQADTAKVHDLTADQLTAATAYVGALDAGNVTAAQLIADHATVGALDSTYAKVDMANVNNAWISSGTIKDGAIVSAMINDVSANKLTAGTINGSVINVTNLNADNITAGTINGQRIGTGSLSLDKLSENVYTESEVDTIVDGLNDRIDGAIETHTGTAVPTLNNQPASSWNTTALKDEHVGDVYYVVNSQSQQNGYCYRFTKSGSTYSWQLIKDSDVTAALSRLTTAEGKITTFDSDISKLKTDTGTLTTKTESLETRMSDAESDILDKVDTTTFNEVSDTVDQHSQTLSQHTTAISNKADSSTVTAVTNRVSKNEQDISGINTTIGELQETVESKADGSTVSTISNKLNNVSDTVDGHTQSITSLQNTVSQKADGSTVSTLSSKVNSIEDTVDGHTSQLTSITSTQTTMQSTLDKTVKSSIQLWYSKANTTAPSKPTSQVTSTSTSGNAWRTVVPAYNASYPNYYYCWQYEYTDGTYGWSAVVLDIAMGESQATARTADSNASAAATAATNAQSTANANIKSGVQLWFTKANSTAPNKPTSVVSTSNANTANTWNLVVPVWNSSYPHYYYCYQQQKGDGTYQWTDVVYDRATSEAQQLANTTSTNLSTLQEDYATYKQTTTENVSSIGTRLTTAEGKISTAESNITQNAQNIELKVSKDGVISSINQSAESVTIDADKINLVGSVTIGDLASATQDSVLNSNVQVGGRNLLTGTADWSTAYLLNNEGAFSGEVFTFTTQTSLTWPEISISYPHIPFADVNGKTLTLGFDYRSDDFSDTSGEHYVYVNAAASATVDGPRSKYRKISDNTFDGIFVPTTEWQRGTITFDVTESLFTAGSGDINYFYIQFFNNTLNGFQLRHVKLEKGNKATDWTPAPEDFQSSAVSRTQRIYYRWNSATAPAAPTTWVTKGDDGSALWTKMHVAITSTHKFIYTCEQYEMADGTVGHTDVLLDNTITVIDGGNIITWSVTANKLNASDINASKTLTVGAMTDAAAATILNSNISVGGRNLALDSQYFSHNATANDTYVGVWYLPVAQRVFVSRSDGFVALALKQSQNWAGPAVYMDSLGLAVGDLVAFSCLYEYQGCNANLHFYAMSTNSSGTRIYPKFDLLGSNGYDGNYHSVTKLATISSTNKSGKVWVVAKWSQAAQDTIDAGGHVCFTFQVNDITEVTSGGSVHLYATKIERGNKPTDWTPAPEDVDAAVSDSAKTATSYITQVDQNGITIHPSGGTSNRVEIDADGMEVYKGNVSVASYGDTARIGKEAGPRVVVETNKLSMYAGSTGETKIAEMKEASIGDDVVGLISTDVIVADRIGNEGGPQMTPTALYVPDGSEAYISTMTLGASGYRHKISGFNFGYSTGTTNSNGITTFNPGMGVKPTAVFVAAGKASGETEAVAKIAVPMVWSIDGATQVQVRWKRSDTNAWLASNAVGYYWLAIY